MIISAINYLALKIPSNSGLPLLVPTPPGFKSEFKDLGSTISRFFEVAIYIAGFLMLFWFAWGVFQYLFAGGNKEGLAKARQRMTWAIVGFIFVAISFLLSQFAQEIFPQIKQFNKVTPVSRPNTASCTAEMIRNCGADGAMCEIVDGSPKCVYR